jgi:uncharacterized membrane protein YqjE
LILSRLLLKRRLVQVFLPLSKQETEHLLLLVCQLLCGVVLLLRHLQTLLLPAPRDQHRLVAIVAVSHIAVVVYLLEEPAGLVMTSRAAVAGRV